MLHELRSSLGERAYPYLKGAQERIAPKRRANRRRRALFYRQFVAPGGLAFDIGANMGNRTDALLDIGATVVAVEPQPKCIATLARRFGANARFTLVPVGLADAPGIASLHIATSHVLSSMSPDFMERVVFANNEWGSAVDVRVTTLDALIAVFGIPDFCKIDVEGFEIQVLTGLTQPLPSLSIEHNPPTADATVRCLRMIAALSDTYRFAYSPGESLKLDKRGWQNLDEAIAVAASGDTFFGDFYARM